ncbi:hypothetical protein V6N12_076459 [Hibiscus sabdariffa]|uniref:Uncharacterized protein n=1 Tax=Hibiscus sabdariffa TaxID=183260 RepID=A0ABR2D9V3_9ROSI
MPGSKFPANNYFDIYEQFPFPFSFAVNRRGCFWFVSSVRDGCLWEEVDGKTNSGMARILHKLQINEEEGQTVC